LTTLSHALRPVKSDIHPLATKYGSRDILPDNRGIHELLLTYEWESKEKGKVTPRVPQLNRVLYEAFFEAQLWNLFDSRKRLIGSGDAWPKPVTVQKGKYTLRLQIRHDEVSYLEQLKDLIMTIDISLSKPISLPIYPLLTSAQAQKKPKAVRLSLEAGMRKGLFVAAANVKTLPKISVAGDVLIGSIDLSSMKNKSKYSLPFQYVIPPLPDSKKTKKRR